MQKRGACNFTFYPPLFSTVAQTLRTELEVKVSWTHFTASWPTCPFLGQPTALEIKSVLPVVTMTALFWLLLWTIPFFISQVLSEQLWSCEVSAFIHSLSLPRCGLWVVCSDWLLISAFSLQKGFPCLHKPSAHCCAPQHQHWELNSVVLPLFGYIVHVSKIVCSRY